MFVFIKKVFYIGSLFLSSLVGTTSLNCNSITSKCSGSCNNINDSYAKICVSDVIKDLNVKVFNLMSRTNETRHIKWHEMCKCKCRFNASVCNNKQCWNNDKCQCECKELLDKGICDKEYILNPSNKSSDFGEYYIKKIVNVEKDW